MGTGLERKIFNCASSLPSEMENQYDTLHEALSNWGLSVDGEKHMKQRRNGQSDEKKEKKENNKGSVAIVNVIRSCLDDAIMTDDSNQARPRNGCGQRD